MTSFNPNSILLKAPVWQKPYGRLTFSFFMDKWFSYWNQGGRAHIMVGIPLEAQLQFNLTSADQMTNFNDYELISMSGDRISSVGTSDDQRKTSHINLTSSVALSGKRGLKSAKAGRDEENLQTTSADLTGTTGAPETLLLKSQACFNEDWLLPMTVIDSIKSQLSYATIQEFLAEITEFHLISYSREEVAEFVGIWKRFEYYVRDPTELNDKLVKKYFIKSIRVEELKDSFFVTEPFTLHDLKQRLIRESLYLEQLKDTAMARGLIPRGKSYKNRGSHISRMITAPKDSEFQEPRDSSSPVVLNQGGSSKNSTESTLTSLSGTIGGTGSKENYSGQRKSRDVNTVTCYHCGHKGHYASACTNSAKKESHDGKHSDIGTIGTSNVIIESDETLQEPEELEYSQEEEEEFNQWRKNFFSKK
jgi:hypothetical protein